MVIIDIFTNVLLATYLGIAQIWVIFRIGFFLFLMPVWVSNVTKRDKRSVDKMSMCIVPT